MQRLIYTIHSFFPAEWNERLLQTDMLTCLGQQNKIISSKKMFNPMVVIIIQVPINSKTWCDYDFQLQVVQEDTSCGSLQMVDPPLFLLFFSPFIIVFH